MSCHVVTPPPWEAVKIIFLYEYYYILHRIIATKRP